MIAYVDMAAIPRRWLEANCELAWYFFSNSDKDPWKDSALGGFEQLGVGPISLRPRVSARPSGALPNVVIRLVGGWRTSGGRSVRLERS